MNAEAFKVAVCVCDSFADWTIPMTKGRADAIRWSCLALLVVQFQTCRSLLDGRLEAIMRGKWGSPSIPAGASGNILTEITLNFVTRFHSVSVIVSIDVINIELLVSRVSELLSVLSLLIRQ